MFQSHLFGNTEKFRLLNSKQWKTGASSPYRIVLPHSNEISDTSCGLRRTIQYITFISTNILNVLSDTAVICSPEFLRIGSFLSDSHILFNWVTVIYREGPSYVKGTGSSDYMLYLKSSHLSCTWVLWTLLAQAHLIGDFCCFSWPSRSLRMLERIQSQCCGRFHNMWPSPQGKFFSL